MSDGIEFAAIGEGFERRGGEAMASLAVWLGVSVSEVLQLRDHGALVGAIERRNSRQDAPCGCHNQPVCYLSPMRHIERRAYAG